MRISECDYISSSNTAHYTRKHIALPTFSYEHFDISYKTYKKRHSLEASKSDSILCMQKTNEYTACISKLERKLASGNF
jgi:hypothetical protein